MLNSHAFPPLAICAAIAAIGLAPADASARGLGAGLLGGRSFAGVSRTVLPSIAHPSLTRPPRQPSPVIARRYSAGAPISFVAQPPAPKLLNPLNPCINYPGQCAPSAPNFQLPPNQLPSLGSAGRMPPNLRGANPVNPCIVNSTLCAGGTTAGCPTSGHCDTPRPVLPGVQDTDRSGPGVAKVVSEPDPRGAVWVSNPALATKIAQAQEYLQLLAVLDQIKAQANAAAAAEQSYEDQLQQVMQQLDLCNQLSDCDATEIAILTSMEQELTTWISQLQVCAVTLDDPLEYAAAGDDNVPLEIYELSQFIWNANNIVGACEDTAWVVSKAENGGLDAGYGL
jgi:hypothetical protein